MPTLQYRRRRVVVVFAAMGAIGTYTGSHWMELVSAAVIFMAVLPVRAT